LDNRIMVVRDLVERVVAEQDQIRIEVHLRLPGQLAPQLRSGHTYDPHAKTPAPTPVLEPIVSPEGQEPLGISLDLTIPIPPPEGPNRSYPREQIHRIINQQSPSAR
jgi:hypothetical protein